MSKKDIEELEKFKDQIIDNLEIIKENLENFEKIGLEDFDETLYNEITELIDETDSVEEILGLSEIIIKGKNIEIRLDSWGANHGISNFELTWPNI